MMERTIPVRECDRVRDGTSTSKARRLGQRVRGIGGDTAVVVAVLRHPDVSRRRDEKERRHCQQCEG